MEFYDLIGFHADGDEPGDAGQDRPDLSRSLILTDFDGTLVDLAQTPDGITVAPRVSQVLAGLMQRTGGAVAVVSGRRLSDLRRFLPEFDGTLVASHGAEWIEDGEVRRHEVADSPELANLRTILGAYAAQHPDILIEDKPCSVVLHFRQAEDRMGDAERFLSVLAEQWPGFTLHHAKMALEVMPETVSKRVAVEGLLERWPDRMPIAFGDDATDEGMLGLATDRGGLGYKVGEGQTVGNRRVDDPGAVLALMESWLAREGRT